ncbi:MAG: hypothetical protein K2N34_13615 [Lachnospiraceae bacterium]|nr:hypothetical protein [Lachnospiraceae bacterium]
MKYSRQLTLAHLIREMREASASYGRSTQIDTISDIADIIECQELAFKENTWFERFWGLRHSGTVMCRTQDFGEWEDGTVDRYRIMWSEQSGWTFEEL